MLSDEFAQSGRQAYSNVDFPEFEAFVSNHLVWYGFATNAAAACQVEAECSAVRALLVERYPYACPYLIRALYAR
jgi:hypothetical protein